MPSEESGKRKVTPLVVVLVIVIVACIAGGIAGGMYLVNTYSQIRDVENSQSMAPALPGELSENQANPIDFAALSGQNADIYSWIYLPNTTINYPVCQSADNDSYYLDHNASHGETELGAIFSEHQFNNRDYQDRVTILYGHNGFGDTMFTDLHKFEHQDFFNANEKVYVYAPGHVYTYEIVSAFMSDERHLMGKYNFQDERGFARFLNDIQNPNAIGANVRPVALDESSKVLVLSTCNTGALEATGRYIVCGVMVDDRPTQ